MRRVPKERKGATYNRVNIRLRKVSYYMELLQIANKSPQHILLNQISSEQKQSA